MFNIVAVIRGHYLAGVEHCLNNNLAHKTTWSQAVMVTLHDLIHYKTITEGSSYVVYEVVNKRTIGIKVSQVVAIYVPKELRGIGVASRLLDAIPEKFVISSEGNYEEVGRLVLCRRNDT